jgi:Lon protease-like protein
LILEGLCRVRFLGWPQLEPFRQAEVESFAVGSLESGPELERRLAFLRAALRRFEPRLPPELREKMAQITQPEVLLDVTAGVLLTDESQRQSILEEADGLQRQRLLLRLLEEMKAS